MDYINSPLSTSNKMLENVFVEGEKCPVLYRNARALVTGVTAMKNLLWISSWISSKETCRSALFPYKINS